MRPVNFHSRNCDLPLPASEPVELASLFPSPFDRLRGRKIFSTLRQAQGPETLFRPVGFKSRNCDLPLAASEPVELASLFHHPSTSSGSGYFSQPFDKLRDRKIYSSLRQAQGPEFGFGQWDSTLVTVIFYSRTVSLSNWLAFSPHPSTGSGSGNFSQHFDMLRDRNLVLASGIPLS